MWKALVLVVKSTTSLGRPYYPPGSAIYFDFSLSRCCITLFWGFLSNKNLVFTSCGRLFHHIFKIFLLKYGDFLLVYHNLILKLRLIASQRSNRHHLKMRCPNGEPFWAWIFPRKIPFFSFASLLAQWKSPFTWWFSGQKRNPTQFRCLHLTVNSQWNCEFRCIGVRIGG